MFVNKNILFLLSIVAFVVGIATGLILRLYDFSEQVILVLGIAGDIYMNLLYFISFPLLVSMIIAGFTQVDKKILCLFSMRTASCFAMSTFIASIHEEFKFNDILVSYINEFDTRIHETRECTQNKLGFLLAWSMHPGNDYLRPHRRDNFHDYKKSIFVLLDLIRNAFPSNIVRISFSVSGSQITRPPKQKDDAEYVAQWKNGEFDYYDITYVDGFNLMGVVTTSICVGVVANRLNSKRRTTIVKLIVAIESLFMATVKALLWYSPIGIFSITVSKLLAINEPLSDMMGVLGLYTVAVIFGLLSHVFIVLPIIYFGITFDNPYRVILKSSQALITAFTTSSSQATLPITFQCCEENLQIREQIAHFVIPLSMVNMNGACLVHCLSAIFIAQYYTVELSIIRYALIILSSCVASWCTSGMPASTPLTMSIVLASAGINPGNVEVIIPIDFLLDRFATTANVMGNIFCAAVINFQLRHRIPRVKREDEPKKVVNNDPKKTDTPLKRLLRVRQQSRDKDSPMTRRMNWKGNAGLDEDDPTMNFENADLIVPATEKFLLDELTARSELEDNNDEVLVPTISGPKEKRQSQRKNSPQSPSSPVPNKSASNHKSNVTVSLAGNPKSKDDNQLKMPGPKSKSNRSRTQTNNTKTKSRKNSKPSVTKAKTAAATTLKSRTKSVTSGVSATTEASNLQKARTNNTKTKSRKSSKPSLTKERTAVAALKSRTKSVTSGASMTTEAPNLQKTLTNNTKIKSRKNSKPSLTKEKTAVAALKSRTKSVTSGASVTTEATNLQNAQISTSKPHVPVNKM